MTPIVLLKVSVGTWKATVLSKVRLRLDVTSLIRRWYSLSGHGGRHCRRRPVGKQCVGNKAIRKRSSRLIGARLCQSALCFRSVPLAAVTILLKRVLNDERLIANVLSIHRFSSSVTGVKSRELHKPKALRGVRLRVAHDVRSVNNGAECAEGLIQQFLVHSRSEISNKQIRTDIMHMPISR